MMKHPTIELTAHTKIMKLVMDYNAAGRTDVSRLADHILLTVKDSMDALDMRQERAAPSERPKSEARCLICGKAWQGDAPTCYHSILEQDSWRERLRQKRLEDHDCAVARGEAEPL